MQQELTKWDGSVWSADDPSLPDEPSLRRPAFVTVAGAKLRVRRVLPDSYNQVYDVHATNPSLDNLLGFETETLSWIEQGPIAFAFMLLACSLERPIYAGSNDLIEEAALSCLAVLIRNIIAEAEKRRVLFEHNSAMLDQYVRHFAENVVSRIEYRKAVEKVLRAMRVHILAGPWIHQRHPHIAISPIDWRDLPTETAGEVMDELCMMTPEPIVTLRMAMDYVRLFDRKNSSMELFWHRQMITACLRVYDAVFGA